MGPRPAGEKRYKGKRRCARGGYFISSAFIILGRDNDEHGKPDFETIARLKVAAAHFGQVSCIVLTGYDDHNQSMSDWLRTNTHATLPVHCVTAYDTVGQAVFTAAVTHALRIKNLTVITSDYHLRRTRAIFNKVHGDCCQLTFIGAQHPVQDLDAVTNHEEASLRVFSEKFAHARNVFDCMAILFDHHPRYQRIALEKANPDPNSEDSQSMWNWKNDPISRQMSRTIAVIPWEKHREWYATAATDPKTVILMACVNGIRACMLRFDLADQDCAEISINLNPAMRGKRMSEPILVAACQYGFDTLKLSRIHAEVKPENVRSLKIFEAVGFVYQGSRKGLRTYTLARSPIDNGMSPSYLR